MEKLKKFIASFGWEIIISILIVILFSCLPLSIYIFEFVDESEFSVSFLDLISNATINGITLSPDFVTYFILIVSGISLILVWICKVFEILKIKTPINIISNTMSVILVITLILHCVSSLIVSSYREISKTEISVSYSDLGFIIYLICLGGILLYFLKNVLTRIHFSVKEIVEISMLIALAIVLDKFASIDIGATGGSFNFSGIPLILIAVRYGVGKSLISSSVVFSIITCLLDGYGLQTLPFDYVIAFSGYCLGAISYQVIKKYFIKESKLDYVNIMISSVFAGLGVFITRMIGSSISSIIYYDYSVAEALAYNVLYVGPSAAICVVVAIILSYPLALINRLFPVSKRVNIEYKEENKTNQ